jgi:hypothetical protein
MLSCSSDFLLPLGQHGLWDGKLEAGWACLFCFWDYEFGV